jgi:syntenin-1
LTKITEAFKMSLYPSLEDMKVDHMIQAQNSTTQIVQPNSEEQSQILQGISQSFGQSSTALPYPPNPSAYPQIPSNASGNGSVYPGLGDYMGLELSEDVIRENMPEYLVVPQAPSQLTSTTPGGFVAPISSSSPAFTRSQLSHGIRQVILCKDGAGKVGLKVKAIDKGIFVALVINGSPASMGGMKFGDQILQINGENVAGFSAEKVHGIFKKAGVNNIVLAVRDRPFERTLTLHKDSTGHVGFQFSSGKITAIVVDSSAARNGLLIEHNLLEVNGQNVVGMKDKEISKIIDDAGQVVTVTVIPNFLYRHIMKK